jgi:hypothetical protein
MAKKKAAGFYTEADLSQLCMLCHSLVRATEQTLRLAPQILEGCSFEVKLAFSVLLIELNSATPTRWHLWSAAHRLNADEKPARKAIGRALLWALECAQPRLTSAGTSTKIRK